jgi:hypothetical protein
VGCYGVETAFFFGAYKCALAVFFRYTPPVICRLNAGIAAYAAGALLCNAYHFSADTSL